MREYKPEDTWHECQRCRQLAPPLNLFLCKGRMVCEGCFMTETKGNTIYFDESKYPRKKDMFGNPISRQELIRIYGADAVNSWDEKPRDHLELEGEDNDKI